MAPLSALKCASKQNLILASTPWPPCHASPARLQVNGKMRGAVEVDVSIDQEGAVAAARGLGAVAKQLEGKEVGPGGLGGPCCACCACLGMLGMRLWPDSCCMALACCTVIDLQVKKVIFVSGKILNIIVGK